MQRLAQREEHILDFIVREYIRNAFPVSSGRVFRRLVPGFSPATIRHIMLDLDDASFLDQPHASAGRIPTDKGYRYFVDYLMEYKEPSPRLEEAIDELAREIKERHELLFEHFGRIVARELQLFTGIARFGEERRMAGFGLSETLREPEFEDREQAIQFARLADNIERLAEDYRWVSSAAAKVFIGEENPFPGARAFGAVAARFEDEELGEGVVFSIGPKRMNYERASSLLNFMIQDIIDKRSSQRG